MILLHSTPIGIRNNELLTLKLSYKHCCRAHAIFLGSGVTSYLVPDVLNGFVTAITAVVSGFMIEVVLKAFVDAGLIAPSLILVCQLMGIVALFVFVHATRYWGTLYLFG